jgi:large subunit ribosomal protein L4e
MNMNKNKRQAYAVKFQAGHQCSAECWGTGRAVARVPRCQGGGTSRSAQGAFANMCRGGRMFNPNKIWRRWHRKINKNQSRYAVASALAASAVPALVMARGHAIDEVAELPLVIGSGMQSIGKTQEAMALFEKHGIDSDVDRCAASKKIRPGQGKVRGRRHVIKRGPLIVYDETESSNIQLAVRNLGGVDSCAVTRLNLLQLAPGGHIGRFIVFTQSAFAKLDTIYGEMKSGYTLPTSGMTNPDIARIINSDEVQAAVRPAFETLETKAYKTNPYKNVDAMDKLNPYAKVARDMEERAKKQRSNKKSKATDKSRAAALAFYEKMSADYLDNEEPPSTAFDEEEEEDDEE